LTNWVINALPERFPKLRSRACRLEYSAATANHGLRERLPAHGRSRLPGQDHARVEELIGADKTSLGLAFSKDQTNVACPWHGYEFDISTGRRQANPRLRLRPVTIAVVDGDLLIALPEGMRERIARGGRPPARCRLIHQDCAAQGG